MLFTTYRFVIFLAVVIAAYYVCPPKHRWRVLLISGVVFYAFSGLWNLLYLSGTILTTYAAARRIGTLHKARDTYLAMHKDTLSREDKKKLRDQNQSARRRWLILCLIVNLGVLAAMKYANFTVANVNSLLRLSGGAGDLPYLNLLMPMGISFYTFQSVGYLMDVYRGSVTAQRHVLKCALFCSFFPQMIQGPISRYADLEPSLFGENRFDGKKLSYGLQRILLGFFKKLVIADRLLIVVKTVTQDPEQYQGVYVVAAVFLYAVTLYADFTGGIDIAIGVAESLGITLRENFNRPFYAVSIADYWRRWHITMGTWFKDYLFYPLSVAKPMLRLSKWSRAHLGEGFGKRVPVYLSTITVWFATGAWHGASWNFITWGLVNGMVIILSEECSPLYKRFHSRFDVAQKPWYIAITIVRTFCMMCLIRSLDIFAGVGTTVRALGSMFTQFRVGDISGLTSLGITIADYVVAFAGVALLIWLGTFKGGFRDALAKRPAVLRHGAVILLLLAIVVFGVYGVGYDAKQFIYNQF